MAAAKISVRIFELHDRAVVDEQAGEGGGLGQVTAAIVAQVDDQAVDALFLEFADQPLHVLGRAGVILVAGGQCAIVAIEARHFDDANHPVAAVTRY